MVRVAVLFVGFFALLSSCTQRMICPAYQSAYIYDKEALRKKFSYFKEDSTPKILTASKTKYLIAVPESYRKKMRHMATVEMKPVYPEIPDSLKIEEDADLILAERDVIDSAAAQMQGIEPGDSAYAISLEKEKFNVDQDNYMWYFRDVLVLPDVRAALEGKEGGDSSEGGEEGGEKKKGGFFKNLFKKKDRSDSTSVNGPPLQPSDSTGADNAVPGKKKGKRNKKDAPRKEKDPANKEDENEGLGS